MPHLQATAKCIFTVHAGSPQKKFRSYIPQILSKLLCTRLLRMSPDWIKFDTQMIISVQLLIRKRKVEKFSCVFKKKNEAINETSLAGYETIIFQVSVYTVSRPWAKLFNYINIKDFSYHKKGQNSPTLAVWLFVLSKFDERAVPVSFPALEMSLGNWTRRIFLLQTL